MEEKLAFWRFTKSAILEIRPGWGDRAAPVLNRSFHLRNEDPKEKGQGLFQGLFILDIDPRASLYS
jgi:hypothetical protein